MLSNAGQAKSITLMDRSLKRIHQNLDYCAMVWAFCVKPDFNKHEKLPERAPGGGLNKKDGLTRYGDSHVKDKTS